MDNGTINMTNVFSLGPVQRNAKALRIISIRALNIGYTLSADLIRQRFLTRASKNSIPNRHKDIKLRRCVALRRHSLNAPALSLSPLYSSASKTTAISSAVIMRMAKGDNSFPNTLMLFISFSLYRNYHSVARMTLVAALETFFTSFP